MTPRHYSILTLALLTACGPCMPRDFGDTSTIIGEVCPPVSDETTEVAPGSSDGGAPSTGDDSSSDGTTIIDATESSGVVDETEGPGIPQDGEPNGPCTVLTCWECHVADLFIGSVCVAPCESDDECTHGAQCIDGGCRFPCETASDCPFTGMGCAPNPVPGMCMWLG